MFVRVRRWMVRHKVLVDAIAIAPYLAFSLATIRFYTRTPENLPASLYVTFTLVLLVPLAVRRRYPLAVFAVIASAAFVQWLLDVGLLPADLGVLVGMFTVAAHRRLVWSVAALATTELGLVLAVERWYVGWAILLPYSVFVVGLWLGGLYANLRRSYLAGLEERAARLERERDALAQVAAAEERERIARELHDVVAHNVSVMVVQADGGSYAIDRNPDTAKQALETISRTGREALTEMRRLLGVLRGRDGAGGGSAAGELAPQPGVDELAGLVEQVRSAGLPVELTVEGAPRPLDHGVGLAAYRITQEALTNTLKHAGPAARAWVRVSYHDDTVQTSVYDDGRGLSAAPNGSAGNGPDGASHGVIGMRERAAMVGGTLEAGPRPGGGYRVIATLPMYREVG